MLLVASDEKLLVLNTFEILCSQLNQERTPGEPFLSWHSIEPARLKYPYGELNWTSHMYSISLHLHYRRFTQSGTNGIKSMSIQYN